MARTIVASAEQLRTCVEQAIAVGGVVLLTGTVTAAQPILFGRDASIDSSDPLSRIALLLLYACTAAVLLGHWRTGLRVAWSHWPLIALIGFTAVSAAWSVDAGVTLRRATGMVGTTAFGLMLCVAFPLQRWIGLVAVGISVVAFLSLLAGVIAPDYGIMTGLHEGAWRGVLPHKNILGRTMALGIIASASWRPASRLGRIIAFASLSICSLLLLLSLSRAAWVVVAVALGAAAFSWVLRARLRLLLPVAIAASFATVALLYVLWLTLDELLPLLGRDMTFTGRTLIWLSLAGAIAVRPLLGYGYAAFWSTDLGTRLMTTTQPGFTPSHAHNGWLEIAVGLGVVGVGLFLLSLTGVGFRAIRYFRHVRRPEAYFPLLFLLLLVILSMVESVLLRENSIFWALYTAVALSMSTHAHRPPVRNTVRS